MIRHTLVSIAAVALLLATAGSARAQYGQPPPPPPPGYGAPQPGYPPAPPPPPPGTYRDGLMFGITLGAGAISCDDCNESHGGLGLSFHIGGMVTPTIAIMFEGWGVSHPEDNASMTMATASVAGRLFLAPMAWVQVGLGGGKLSFSSYDDFGNQTATYDTDTGASFSVAAGLELWHTGNFAFDASIHANATHIDDPLLGEFTAEMFTVNIGANWY